MNYELIAWTFFVFAPLFLFVFAKLRFFAICLSCANLCFCAINNIAMIGNENLWGLLQTEIEVSKSVFFLYQSTLICLFITLLFVAHRYTKSRVLILMYFTLCSALLPFSVLEKFIFGY